MFTLLYHLVISGPCHYNFSPNLFVEASPSNNPQCVNVHVLFVK